MIVFAFPPMGQLSSSPPHSVNIFPTTRPHVSGQCPAPRSGVRNVHHASVLLAGGELGLASDPSCAHIPAGVHRREPEGIDS